MNTENERVIEDLIRQLTKEIPFEEPQGQFTHNVLAAIEAEREQSTQIIYTPLISKASWFFIGVIAISLLAIGYFSGEQGAVLTSLFSQLIERSKIMANINLPSISNSKVLLFSSMTFISCVAIQIIWLKKSWAKKHVLF